MDRQKTGANVDSWCTKCKLVLAHTIEAVVGREIKRVQCNTCRGKHMFKASAPGQKSSLPAAPRAKKSPAKIKASSYDALLSGRNRAAAKIYQISSKFKKGDLIEHSTFGFGVVIAELDPQKIEILFELGSKIMVHHR